MNIKDFLKDLYQCIKDSKKEIIFGIIAVMTVVAGSIYLYDILVEDRLAKQLNEQDEITSQKINKIKEQSEEEINKIKEEYNSHIVNIKNYVDKKIKDVDKKRIEEFENANSPQKKIILASDLIKYYRTEYEHSK